MSLYYLPYLLVLVMLWSHDLVMSSMLPNFSYECLTYTLNWNSVGTTFGMQDIIKLWPILSLLPMCTIDAGLSITPATHCCWECSCAPKAFLSYYTEQIFVIYQQTEIPKTTGHAKKARLTLVGKFLQVFPQVAVTYACHIIRLTWVLQCVVIL